MTISTASWPISVGMSEYCGRERTTEAKEMKGIRRLWSEQHVVSLGLVLYDLLPVSEVSSFFLLSLLLLWSSSLYRWAKGTDGVWPDYDLSALLAGRGGEVTRWRGDGMGGRVGLKTGMIIFA